MINLNRKFLSVVLAGLLALVWLGSAHGLISRNMELGEQIHLSRKELAYQKGILLKKKEFNSRFEQIKREAGFDGEGPDERLSLFIAQAEKWAGEQNLLLHDVRPLPVVKKNNMTFLKVALELEGEMNSLGRFLHKMLSSRLPVQIERFSFYQKIRMRPQINLDVEISLLYIE